MWPQLTSFSSLGTRESAFKYAISAAGVAHAVTKACTKGEMSSCGCDERKKEGTLSDRGWQWGGCSSDVRFGLSFTEDFIDSQEIEDNEMSLMNLHNNKVGRKVCV